MKPIAFLEPEKGPEDLSGIALRRIVSVDDWYNEKLSNAVSESHRKRIEDNRQAAKEEYYTPMIDWWPSINAFTSPHPRSFYGRTGSDYSDYEIFFNRGQAVEAWRSRQELP